MEQLPFAPTSLSAILGDLVFLLILTGGPLALQWLRSAQQAAAAYYRAHTSVGERQVLDGLAGDAVAWAERYASSPAGRVKFKEAVAMVQAALDRRGIRLDVAEIEAAVQSAWCDLRQTSASPSIPSPSPPNAAAGRAAR